MKRTLIIAGPSPRVDSTIYVPKFLIDNITDFTRCEVVITLYLSAHSYLNRPIHNKTIAEDIGYKARRTWVSIKKLLDCGLIDKKMAGMYSIKPVAMRDSYPLKNWELRALCGCTFQQIRTWAFVKSHEGIECNRTRLSELIGFPYPSLSRAINTQKRGDRQGIGLLDLNLIFQLNGAWYTPTSDIPKRAQEDSNDGPSAGLPTRVRACARYSSSSTPTSNLSYISVSIPSRDNPSNYVVHRIDISKIPFQSKKSLKIPVKILNYALRFVPRCLGGKKARVDLSHLALRKMTIADAIKQYGKDRLESMLWTLYNIKTVLKDFPWTRDIADRTDELVRPYWKIHESILTECVNNALRWVLHNRPQYNMPFEFLKKWLKDPRNIDQAAIDMDYEPPTWLLSPDGTYASYESQA